MKSIYANAAKTKTAKNIAFLTICDLSYTVWVRTALLNHILDLVNGAAIIILRRITLVVVGSFLLFGDNAARASQEEIRLRICDACATKNELGIQVVIDAVQQRALGNLNPAFYVVTSRTTAVSLTARLHWTWVYEPLPIAVPVVTHLIFDDTEAYLLDQILFARAAFSADHIDDLPVVIYPGGEVVNGGGAGYHDQVFLFMNGNPLVTVPSTAAAMSLEALLGLYDNVFARVAAELFGQVKALYVKVEMSDGSYGVYYVNATTGTVKTDAVYYVDKDGNVYIIDPDLIDNIEDPNIDEETDPDEDSISHNNQDLISGGEGMIFAGVNVNNSAEILFYLCHQVACTNSARRRGIVTIEDIP